MTNNLQSNRLAQIKSRLAAATAMDTQFAIENGAPTEAHNMKLAIRTAAWPLVQNAPADLAWLIERCEKLEDAVNGADSILVCARFPGADLLDIIACANKRLSDALESDGEGR